MSPAGEDGTAQMERALALVQLGKIDEARRALYSVAGESQGDSRWHQISGIIERRAGNHGAAEDANREAVRLSPHSSVHLYNLALSVYDQGWDRAPEALSLLNEALVLSPEDAEAHLLAARILIANGDWRTGGQEAMGAVGEAQRLGIDGAQAAKTLIWIHLRCDRPAAAKVVVKEALKDFPGDTGLQMSYAEMLGDRGADRREAAAVLQSTLAAAPTNERAREELLRRFQLLMVRSRYVVLIAQVAAAFGILLPGPFRGPAAVAGLICTLGVLSLDDRAAKRLAGEDSFRDYLAGHPALRVGRALLRLAVVCAWVPLASAAVWSSGEQLWWAALISVPLGSALAWSGGGLAVRSASADEYDPKLEAPRGVQISWWLQRHLGTTLDNERKASLVGMIIAVFVAIAAPRGVGVAAMALAAAVILSVIADARLGWNLVSSLRHGWTVAPHAGTKIPGRFVLAMNVFFRFGFIFFFAAGALGIGFSNVLGTVNSDATPEDQRQGPAVVPSTTTIPGFTPSPQTSAPQVPGAPGGSTERPATTLTLPNGGEITLPPITR